MRRRVLALALLLLVGSIAVEPAAAAPVTEASLTGVTSVAAGYSHSCARLANGQVRCWGNNEHGQLGDGDPNLDPNTAVTVRNPTGTGPLVNVVQVVLGDYHTCALLTSREVRCWGYNGSHELGNDSTTPRSLPVAVKNASGTGRLQNVAQITAGTGHTCALLTNGQMRCWGDDGDGQLGNGLPEAQSGLPVVVKNVAGTGPLTGVTQADGGISHTCARLGNGQARCWGNNSYGQLGDDTTTPRARPVVVKNVPGTGPLTTVTQLTGGGEQSCARLSNAQVRCWGHNDHGQIGDGSPTDRHRPVVVANASGSAPLAGAVRVEAGYDGSCAVVSGGQARCWGGNDEGELGNGVIGPPEALRPRAVKNGLGTGPLTHVTQLSFTAGHVCVRLTNAAARCWGSDNYGELGDGGTTDSPLPVKVLA